MRKVPPYCVEHWIELLRGDTLAESFVWSQSNGEPVNLAGYTARMQVRPQTGEGAPILDLSTAGGEISLNFPPGTIEVNASSVIMETRIPGEYVYDLELTSPIGKVTTIVAGPFIIYADATRPA